MRGDEEGGGRGGEGLQPRRGTEEGVYSMRGSAVEW